MIDPETSGVVLASEFSDLRVVLDRETGAPAAIHRAGEPHGAAVQIETNVVILTGGREVPGIIGGLAYADTEDVRLAADGELRVREHVLPSARRFSIDVGTTDPRWDVTWHYELRAAAPRLAVRLEVRARADGVVARNVLLDLAFRLPVSAGWRLHAPGNPVRPGFPVADLERPINVASVGGVDGSAGLVAFACDGPDGSRTLTVWPLSLEAIGLIAIHPDPAGARVTWTSDVAGEPGAGGVLDVATLYLDLEPAPFEEVLAEVRARLAEFGITSPADPPAWAPAVSIYEVQIGYGVFADGYTYGPYPEAADLLADLDRIRDLGYDTLQIMPRQPFPSYNAFDYADVTTSYGDEATLRAVVREAHARGMRVILDILLHGVVDAGAIAVTLEAIHAGPFRDRLDEVIPDITVLDPLNPAEADLYPISWARHIVNFGPHWAAGQPERHPLLDAHPEWFTSDSAGAVVGMYSRGFDVAHPGWQRWFIQSALALVDRLDVDGFRFDAPSYNQYHNWGPRTRTNAGVSMLGCLPLFADLRTELRARRPDALLYTEPSGSLYRQSMDLTYNYDEQWLIRSVLTHGADRPHGIRHARDLRAWLAHRDATLPAGSLTAHHLDSHDTFWWPHPGQKWRREQWGLPVVRALLATFATAGGPFMTFVGGEVGIEEQVRATHRLRREHPSFGLGTADFLAAEVPSDEVYAVLRLVDSEWGLAVVNLSDRPVTTRVRLPAWVDAAASATGSGGFRTDDLLWSGTAISWWVTERGELETEVTLQAYQPLAVAAARGVRA